MNLKSVNWRNVLILVLIFIIGFGTGMAVTFKTILNKLAGYNTIV